MILLPPAGDGAHPPVGIEAWARVPAALEGGKRLTQGRMAHLTGLSADGLHTVVFVEYSSGRVLYPSGFREWIPQCHTFDAWEEITAPIPRAPVPPTTDVHRE